MGATKYEDTAPPTFAGATPQDQPITARKTGGGCRRFAFMHSISRVICCSSVELRAKVTKKGRRSGLGNAHVCCSDVKYDSDVEDNQRINGGCGGVGGGGDDVDMENVFFCCSDVKLKKMGKKK